MGTGGSGSPQPTILERIAAWAAGLTEADIPTSTRDRIRLQIATVLCAAAASPWHEPARAVLRARRGRGRALVFATADRRSPLDAAFVNAAFATALDYDDYLLSGHTGYSAVLVPLAYGKTLSDVVVAAAVANELMGRLSTACLLGPVNGQMSSYIHDGGAALALGKIRGLSADQLADAMGLALYQPNFCLVPGFWHPGAKTVTASQPLEQGVRAAWLAAAGLAGPRDLIEHPLGLSAFFAFQQFPGLFDGLGQVWFSDTLSFKRYPGTSYISAAVEAALRCSGGRPLSPESIGAVEVETTILSSALDSLGAAALERQPLDANAINFSVRLSVALALRCGDLTPDGLRPERLASLQGDVRAIAARTRVAHDWFQTLQMVAESPVGLRMLGALSPTGMARAFFHGRRIQRASGAAGRNRSRIRGLLAELPRLARSIPVVLRGPVSALQFEPAAFRMRQSARVTLRGAGLERTEAVDVPWGACGRDAAETRDLVRWRCAQAFGDRAEAVWTAVHDPQSTVAELEAAAVGAALR